MGKIKSHVGTFPFRCAYNINSIHFYLYSSILLQRLSHDTTHNTRRTLNIKKKEELGQRETYWHNDNENDDIIPIIPNATNILQT